jgi:hypothetical protein
VCYVGGERLWSRGCVAAYSDRIGFVMHIARASANHERAARTSELPVMRALTDFWSFFYQVAVRLNMRRNRCQPECLLRVARRTA